MRRTRRARRVKRRGREAKRLRDKETVSLRYLSKVILLRRVAGKIQK